MRQYKIVKREVQSVSIRMSKVEELSLNQQVESYTQEVQFELVIPGSQGPFSK